ncbi:WD repeat-containing protein [Aureococcus anophagefferens]|nr:WD repeat-containing protein [Aureococcus anophagefferens]
MPAEDLPIELEHAIGLSALRGGLHYHPNGREYLYAAGASIVVCDFEDPHAQAFLRGHDDSITCVAMSAKGALVASGQRGENADAIVWDYERKSLLFRLSEHDHAVSALAFSHDELLLCTVGNVDDGKLLVWDMANGCIVTMVSAEPSPTVCVAWGGFVKDVKRRDTQDYLFCTAGGKKLSLWSLNPYSGELSSERVSTDGRGCTVREMTWVEFSEDRETIYCGTTSGDFTLVNVRKRSASGTTVFASRSGVESLLAKPDGGLVTGGGDGTVTAFDAKLHDVAQVQLPGAVVALSFSPDRGELIAGVASGAIYRLRGDLGKALLVCENHARPVASAHVHVRDAGEPTCVVYTLDFLISGWSDGKIRAHESDTSTPLWLIDHAHRGGVSALVLANNQRFIMTGGGEGDVRVWELRSRELVSHLKEHRFLCWELRNEKRMTSHTQRMGGINSIALSKDQTNVFTVGQEKRLTRWDLRDQNFLEAVDLSDDQSDEASCVAVSNSGLVVATGGTKKLLKLYETAPGHKLLASVVGHSGAIRDLKFSPDDKQLVTVGEDGVIFVWNLYVD